MVAEDYEPVMAAAIRTVGLEFLVLRSQRVIEIVEAIETAIIFNLEVEEGVTVLALSVAVDATERVNPAVVVVVEAENQPSPQVGAVSHSATAVVQKWSHLITLTQRKLWKPQQVRSSITSKTRNQLPLSERPRRSVYRMELSSYLAVVLQVIVLAKTATKQRTMSRKILRTIMRRKNLHSCRP